MSGRLGVPSIGVKSTREYLCTAQHQATSPHAKSALGQLIAECDRLRPLAPDGKHGDRRCTPWCGCEDRRRGWFWAWLRRAAASPGQVTQ